MAANFVRNKVTTDDGTSLSYHTIGSGPGLLLLHGAASHGMTHGELAFLLSKYFTVHLLSRRSRGLSGPYPESITTREAVIDISKHSEDRDSVSDVTIGGVSETRTYDPHFSLAVMEVELSDLDLILETTKSFFALGVSSGALLLLAACLCSEKLPAFSRVQKLVIFEPPLQFTDIDTGLDVMGARRYEDEMKSDDVAAAMVTAMKLVQLGPGWVPRPVMKFLTKLMLRSQKKIPRQDDGESDSADEGNSTMLELAPMLRYDFALAEYMIGAADRFKSIGKDKDILLLTGSNSPAYLKIGIDKLAVTITGVQKVMIEGVGHEVLCNKDFRGRPERALGIINNFLTSNQKLSYKEEENQQ